MRLSSYIARRYLLGKKSNQAINIITWISIGGMAVGAAALILVLSVFNGLSTFVESLFSSFDPQIKIEAARGQYFVDQDSTWQYLADHPEVAALTRTIEGQIGLEYVDNQHFAILKGIESNFGDVNDLEKFIYEGEMKLGRYKGIHQALMGSLVAYYLSANIYDEYRPVEMFFLPPDATLTNPLFDVKTANIFPSGYFSIQKDYDERYVIAEFGFVREFFDMPQMLSAYEIKLRNPDRAGEVKDEIQARLGPEFEVLTWYEQHRTLYRVMRNEKYVSYLIMVLMLAIAAVNIVGSLSMIVLEKTRDIAVLKSMGASGSLIRRVFLTQGLLVGAIGAGIGTVAAFVIGWSQQQFGIIRLQGGESFRVKAFPVELQATDFGLVFLTVIALTMLAAYYPAFQAGKINVNLGLRR